MKRRHVRYLWWLMIAAAGALAPGMSASQSSRAMDADKASVIEHWTSERRAQALPRDLVIDPRGLGYLKRPDGTLVPHGHAIAAEPAQGRPVPRAAPGGGDSDPPAISAMDPAAGAVIGASKTFSAKVTDASGVKSVTFKLQKKGSTVQSFAAVKGANDSWSVALQGFTDGDWSWWVDAKDNATRGGNTATSPVVPFKVSTDGIGGGGGGGGSGNTVTNAHWTGGGTVTTAAGRVYFEMPGNQKRKTWWGYVCSGTVATEPTSGRSVIVTAAHCVYDDVNKAFARNVMFIPDQDGTSGSGTDRNCSNDPLGCWVASFGVVDVNWTTRTFPNNVAWDYGFYVVADTGAHQGTTASSDALDSAAGHLAISFDPPVADADASSEDFTHALGYSLSNDPQLMFCAEDMTQESAVNWWLPSCALSGGSSGGPWLQPLNGGAGPIISVNSWGYTNSPGMAGPKFFGTSAVCVFDAANSLPWPQTALADGDAGKSVTCP